MSSGMLLCTEQNRGVRLVLWLVVAKAERNHSKYRVLDMMAVLHTCWDRWGTLIRCLALLVPWSTFSVPQTHVLLNVGVPI